MGVKPLVLVKQYRDKIHQIGHEIVTAWVQVKYDVSKALYLQLNHFQANQNINILIILHTFQIIQPNIILEICTFNSLLILGYLSVYCI